MNFESFILLAGKKGCCHLNEGEKEGCNYYLDSKTGHRIYFGTLAVDGSGDFCLCKDHLCNYGNGTSSYQKPSDSNPYTCKEGSQICYSSVAGGRAVCCKHGANACITKKSSKLNTSIYGSPDHLS